VAGAGGFDVSGAVGAGLGSRQRARDFIAESAAARTRPLALDDGYGEDVPQAAEEHPGVRLPAARAGPACCSAGARA
jgi:hypothetical protein